MSNDQKTELLFKQFNNVVNARQEADFSTTTQNKFPFRNYVNNKEIFSNDIPDELSNITFTNSFNVTSYGCEALDFSFNQAGVADGTIYNIPNTDLTFFYRVDLQQAIPQTNRTWYLPDISNNNFSSLNDTIPYNYDPTFNSYKPVLYGHGSNIPEPLFSTNGGNLKWLIDYKSGFVEFYGDDADITNWLTTNNPPRISLIKYTGPKGAAGGSGGGGGSGDASFNNVDISGDLNVANLTVTESASLPKDTLIQPIWYDVEGSNIPTHPFFDKEYAQTQSYNALSLDPSVNLITSSDWITIARVGENISSNQDGRADALFKISHPASGRHETITFIASFKFARGLSINVLQHDWYSGPNFQALRIAYEDTYDGAVLQLKCTNFAFSPAGRLNPLQIYIKDDHDYPGWEQNTFDVSGSIILDGREVFYAVPNNNPRCQDPSSTLFTKEFLLDNLDWNPGSANANQITTNPARFTNKVDVIGDITTDSSVGAQVNVVAGQAVIGTAGVFDGLTVTNDAEVGRFLTVNGDGYVSGFEKNNFNMSNTYLADIDLYIQPFNVADIKNLTCKALFEITVSDDDPSNFNSERNQIIVGTITVTSSVGTASTSDLDFGLMVNIIHSSWCDRSSSSPAPLINKVFLQGQLASSPAFITTNQVRLWIDGPSSNIPYISFKLKNNNLNQYGTPLPNLKFGKYFIANTGFGTSAPAGNMKAEAIIPSDKKSFTSLGADQVDIPNFLSRKIEIGDSNSNISFKAHQFTLSGVANNNWFTIARLGTDNTNSTAQNRGVAVIEIYNRQSVRHQCVRMFVSQIFDKGGSIDAYNVGYNTGGIQYQAVRLVTGATYDGALLQIKAGPGIQNGTSYPHYVNLMLSTNEPGWQIIDDQSVVNADNNPLIYSGPNNNGTNTYSPPTNYNWTEVSLLIPFGFTNTQGPRAYTGKITTLPTTFQGARLQVNGEYIVAYSENGFGGIVGSVDGKVKVESSTTGDELLLELDTNGNSIIKNTNSSNGTNINIESDNEVNLTGKGNINITSTGSNNNNNIILDNTIGGSAGTNTGDLVGKARANVDFLCENRLNNNKILFTTWGIKTNNGIQFTHWKAPNPYATSAPNATEYTMKWSGSTSGKEGLSVGTHNVVDVKNILGDDNRSSNMTIRADSYGVNSTAKAVHITNPLKLAESSSGVVNSGINAQSYGTMAYDFNLNSIVCKPRSASSSIGPGQSPFILTTPTVIRLMDYTNNYRTGGGQTTTYQRPTSNSTRAWCTGHSWGPFVSLGNFGTWDDQIAYNGYIAPHDGYLTHVEFGGLPPHKPTNGGIWTIVRGTNFPVNGGQPTILKLQFLTPNNNWQDIGDILTGPTTTSSTNTGTQVRWEFDINPNTKKLFFKKGNALLFRVYWEQVNFIPSGISTDQLFCNVVNLGKSGSGSSAINGRKTVFDLFATMVFIPEH